jgi:hypothetical protein
MKSKLLLFGFLLGMLQTGFSQPVAAPSKYMNPYLQNMKTTSVYVNWLTPAGQTSPVSVNYGLTSALGTTQTGTSTAVSSTNNYCTVQLTGLKANTVYYYKCTSGTGSSGTYQFRSAVAPGTTGQHIIFSIIGDTRSAADHVSPDTLVTGRNSRALEATLKTKYGANYWTKVSHVLNGGDLVMGESNGDEYSREYFLPFSNLTKYLPTYVSIGNHEGNGSYFFNFMKYEDLGPTSGDLEKYYKFQTGNCLFLMVNSNTNFQTPAQINWFTTVLDAAKNDNTIDFIFLTFHHPGHSETWPDGNTGWIQTNLYDLLKNYPKVSMIIYGHSHCYERGYLPLNPSVSGYTHDAKLLLQGGGGSEMDTWTEYTNQQDYPEIHRSMSVWGYTIVDVDVDDKSWTAESYNIGMQEELPVSKNELLETFHQYSAGPPLTPTAVSTTAPAPNSVTLQASPFQSGGTDVIQSSQFQVRSYPSGTWTTPLVDSKRDYENIRGYSLKAPYKPVDYNTGIDLTKLVVTTLTANKQYAWRVRYCDQSLRWTPWSNEVIFTNNSTTDVPTLETSEVSAIAYPNPMNELTTIQLNAAIEQNIKIEVYDVGGHLIKLVYKGALNPGQTTFTWNGTDNANDRVAKGSYVIKIESEKMKTNLMMIVQ